MLSRNSALRVFPSPDRRHNSLAIFLVRYDLTDALCEAMVLWATARSRCSRWHAVKSGEVSTIENTPQHSPWPTVPFHRQSPTLGFRSSLFYPTHQKTLVMASLLSEYGKLPPSSHDLNTTIRTSSCFASLHLTPFTSRRYLLHSPQSAVAVCLTLITIVNIIHHASKPSAPFQDHACILLSVLSIRCREY